jgi:hypothetical protein
MKKTWLIIGGIAGIIISICSIFGIVAYLKDWNAKEYEKGKKDQENRDYGLIKKSDSISENNKYLYNKYDSLLSSTKSTNSKNNFKSAVRNFVKTNSLPPSTRISSADNPNLDIIKIQGNNNEKIKELEYYVNYFESKYYKAIKDNDSLRGQISLMDQQLNRAKELQKEIDKTDDKKVAQLLNKELNTILCDVESNLRRLFPNTQPKNIYKTDTIVKTISTTLIDYNGLGENQYQIASDLDIKLRNQPDSYFLRLIKNKTKADFVQSALDSYNKALYYFKLSSNIIKIKELDMKIIDFKQFFSNHLQK